MSLPIPASALTTGSIFHNWRLEHVVGRGGMGTVYFAKHQLVGRPAAIKVIAPPKGTVADPKAMARFQTEVELHVSLRLPNLPDFYDAELLPDGTAVLVLEFLDGRDLAETLRFLGRLPLGDALFVLTEVLRPLQVIHAQSVHRDIKPSNLFLRRRPRFDSEGRIEKNRVTLLDFGIAKMNLKPGVTREHVLLGTKCYMSTEQLKGLPLDGRSDLYAAGAVLYEMLCGHPPYVPDLKNVPSFAEVLVKHLGEPLPDLRAEVPGLPDDVWELVSVLLAKEPADRYASADAALAVARSLRTRYRESARLFRDDVEDVIAAMDGLKAEGWTGAPPLVTNPMATDPASSLPFASTEETAGAPPPDASRAPVSAPRLSGLRVIEVGDAVAPAPPTPAPAEPPAPPAASAPRPERPAAPARPTMMGLSSPASPPSTAAQARPPAITPAVQQPAVATPSQPIDRSAPKTPPHEPAIAVPRSAPPATSRQGIRGTEKLYPGGRAPLEAWEERQLMRARELLRAPRIFRRPALVQLDAATGRRSRSMS